MPQKKITTKPRIVWVDLLKLIAICMMLAVHCTDNVTPVERFTSEYKLWGSLYGSFLRPAIPFFVMITGILLLPLRENFNTFYKKRVTRVLIPFLIWSVLYNLFPFLTKVLGFKPEIIHNFFAWAGEAPSQEFSDAFHNILMIPFNFTVYTTHLWYIYVIIGLYLYMPIFSAWVEKSSKKNQQIFLGLWTMTLFIPYLNEYLSENLLGTCSWNAFGMLYYFAGFNGYLLLGYYLNRYVSLSWKKTLQLAIPLFLLGYTITFIGFKTILSDPTSTEHQIELFYTYCSINVAMMTIALFIIIKKINIRSSRIQKLLANHTKCGFGIYLSHYCFLGPCYDLVEYLPLPTLGKMVLSSFLLLGVTWTVVSLFYRIPKAKYLFG